MANNLLSLRLPVQLERECAILSKQCGYVSSQEFIREAIRDKIHSIKRTIAWREIQKIPLQKGKTVSIKERNALARKM